MKKFLAFISATLLLMSSLLLVACGSVPIEEITIDKSVTEYKVGDTFTLNYTTVPEDAADQIKVNWEISDSTILSCKNGEFTAHTFGTVTVKANVKGNEATDEIELEIKAPDGFGTYTAKGYKLVYPEKWNYQTLAGLPTWMASNGSANMNIETSALNKTYFAASASAFQSAFETQYALMGMQGTFTQPVTLKKEKYLGIQRVRLDWAYSVTQAGVTVTLHQSQMIINNEAENMSCLLTITCQEQNYDAAFKQMEDTIYSQFTVA